MYNYFILGYKQCFDCYALIGCTCNDSLGQLFSSGILCTVAYKMHLKCPYTNTGLHQPVSVAFVLYGSEVGQASIGTTRWLDTWSVVGWKIKACVCWLCVIAGIEMSWCSSLGDRLTLGRSTALPQRFLGDKEGMLYWAPWRKGSIKIHIAGYFFVSVHARTVIYDYCCDPDPAWLHQGSISGVSKRFLKP